MYYQLTIDETGRNSLKTKPQFFNAIVKDFGSIIDIENFISDRYGKIPKGKNKIYRDGENGRSQEVGFMHSFWNRDISHNSKAWYQTDWICICSMISKPVLL
jgi:hypothetical protein